MTRYDEIAARWVDRNLGRTDKRPLRNDRMFTEGDRIFSYGHHFELGRFLRDRKANPTAVLLNGDRHSVTTSRHQGVVRSAAHGSGLPIVILPYSALGAAGIDPDTVEIVDVTQDRHETIRHHTTEMPPRAEWHDIRGDFGLTPEELQAKADAMTAENIADWERSHGWAKAGNNSYWEKWATENPDPPAPCTVDDIPRHARSEYRPTGERTLRIGWHEVGIDTDFEGVTHYRWETTRHWLGESLIRARVTWIGFTPCKACKRTGLDNDFHGPFTVDRANNVWASKPECPVCDGSRGRSFTRSRQALFLSGFDVQEARPLYFFCELPKDAEAHTVAEAYEALKPGGVKLAEEMGREVVRQGDIFAIPVNLDKRTLRKRGARFQKRGNLLGTNHEASQVAYLEGLTFVRGTLYHNPEFREPDHARRKLGDGRTWHAVQKNCVPIAA